jgi:hypothetical protein
MADNGVSSATDAEVAANTAAVNQNTTAIDNNANSTSRAQSILLSYGQAASQTKGLIGNLTSAYGDFITSLERIGQLTPTQINQFGLVSIAAMGMRDAFTATKLEGQGFSEQLKYLAKDIEINGGAIGKMSSFAKQLGSAIPISIIKQGSDAVLQFVTNLAKGADNTAKMQKEFIAMSAATGNLDNVMKSAGPGLMNMNAIMNKQADIINTATKATGMEASAVEAYYLQLGKIPGALESNISATAGFGKNMTMLTATIKLAQGTGREFSSIMTDLGTAFHVYGLKGGDALKFSARMGEVANNLGIELGDVQKHLSSTATMFDRFADAEEAGAKMSEGLAKVTNEYAQALEKSGMTGTHALSVIKDMTQGIANMNLQQKAFLSGQTGGPGGLMGAFQIEKMMRSGDVEGVLKKMRDQMRQQFGRIVTLDEAASNQGAAAQLTKQIAILKAGPLGKMIGSDQDAIKMLESFDKMDKGVGGKGLQANILQKGVAQGDMIQQRMGTDIGVMRSIMESTQRTTGVGAFGLMSSNLTGKASQKAFKADAERRGAFSTEGYAEGIKRGSLMKDTSSESVVGNIEHFKSFYANISSNLAETIDGVEKALMSPDDQAQLVENRNRMKLAIDEQKKGLSKLKGSDRADAEMQIQDAESVLASTNQYINSKTGKVKIPGPASTSAMPTGYGLAGTVDSSVSANKVSSATGTVDGVKMKFNDVYGPITVKTEVVCPKCQQVGDHDHNQDAILPGSGPTSI